MSHLTIDDVRAELAANARADAVLNEIGQVLLETLGLPAGTASFRWAALPQHHGMTHLIGRPLRVELSDRLTPEQAADTLFHEIAHVVAAVAGEGRGIDHDTGHHGDVYQDATLVLSETFGLPRTNDPHRWPNVAWRSRVRLVGPGW